MRWLIAADDRTGALETAGMCARSGAKAVVSTRLDVVAAPVDDGDVLVVDLATRHVPAPLAGRRTAALHTPPGTRRGHKIDSLLRGNWAAEVLALGRRAVIIAAFPAMGRTCVGGVVRARGTPVDQLPDIRRAASTARPASQIPAAEVTHRQLDRWLADDRGVAVCDAATDDDLAAIAAILDDHPEVVVVGTSAALAACAGGDPPHPPTPLPTPALVISGSAHPVAHAQLAALRGLAEVMVLAAESLPGDGLGGVTGSGVLGELATAAHRHLELVRTLVVIGGDTAAAVLGPADLAVSGTVSAGMAWCARVFDRDLQLITKAGAYGDERSILELFVE